MDQVEFGRTVGLELIEVRGEELLEFGGVLGGEDQSFRSEAMFECVLRRAPAAGFGFGAAGFCAVDTGGFGFGQG